MRENFDKTVVLDFSKLTDKEVAKAHLFLSQMFPDLADAFQQYYNRNLTVDDVFNLMSEGMPNQFGNTLPADQWKALCSVICRVHPGVVFSLILRVIAVEMDKAYADHISNCDVVYVYSTTDGRIYQINSSSVTKNSWKYFAAFRSQEDAIKAVKLAQAVKHAIFK